MNTLVAIFRRFTVKSTAVKEHWLSFLINVDRKIEHAFKKIVNKALSDIKRCITDETAPLFQAQTDLANGECAL
jgi:hypothetical protein